MAAVWSSPESRRAARSRTRCSIWPTQLLSAGDLVFAYLGGGEPPSLPPYEAFDVPSEQRSVYKVFQDCNYLQGNEGNIDPQHLSFLHRLSRPGDLNQTLNTQVTAPHLELEDTDFGIRIYAVRKVDEENTYVRVTNFVMPNLAAVAGDAEGYSINWHVPIDDTHHWRYGIRFNRTQPIRPQQNARSEEIGEDFRLIRNESNRYLQDRESMKSRAFIGMGPNFVVHDAWATQGEGRGPEPHHGAPWLHGHGHRRGSKDAAEGCT